MMDKQPYFYFGNLTIHYEYIYTEDLKNNILQQLLVLLLSYL